MSVRDFRPRGVEYRALEVSDLADAHLLEGLRIWREWRQKRPAPIWEDVDLFELPGLLISLATVVDVIDEGSDFQYRFWGSHLTELFGRDETDTRVSENAVSESGAMRMQQFRDVTEANEPRIYVTIFERTEGIICQKTNLRLPIIDDDGAVSKIVTLCTLRGFAVKTGEEMSDIWLESKWTI